MNIQELATIKHYNLPIKLFVLNNGGYGLIRGTQKRFGLGLMGESPKTGVWCPDLKKIAKAYGIKYNIIYSIKHLDNKIHNVLNSESPFICEVMTPHWEELLRT